MNLCPFSEYKYIFGIPGEGLHSYKLLNTAMIDYGVSLLLAFMIAYFSNVPLVLSTIGVLISGVFMHILFGVNTDTVKYLGLECLS